MTWSAERYFAKAQRYWCHASGLPRDSEMYLLQISFFCEFLIRGCLVKAHSALNAVANEDSIRFAAGLLPEKPANTVEIKFALKRLQSLIPTITEDEAVKLRALFDIRNSELHGDMDDVSAAKAGDFLPSVYALTVRITEFSKQDLAALLGAEGAKQANDIYAATTKDRRKRVLDLIKIQKDRFFSLPREQQSKAREKSKPDFGSAVLKSGHHVIGSKCPSCANLGLLAGSPVGQSGPILRDNGIYKEIRVQPDIFQCKCCDLKIKGLDELMAAGFDHEFTTLDGMDVVEYFGIDPMDYVDVDEITREYARDIYEYQDE